ncbi:helix-turn-helix transcriptional regulator [Paenibacillus sp. M1]|uniref:Helix-turn-helix transcriptional regulator n=1 Tax=Paenibacillus haidiansis TaxID=1574488 RepID=A0ABU7VSQ1_9BACL
MNSSTILAELDSYIKHHGLNVRQLAGKLELNPGTVSHILNGSRKLTMDQLDQITEMLGYSQGHFYSNYIHEYLVENDPNWRRIRPFLFNCAELGKLDCIREVVNVLLDNLMYSPLLFEAAEELFYNGKYEAAEILYENVADSERKQHSERLAMCQYRLFTIRIGKDQMQNFKIASQFEPFVERLDEIQQLDALKDLCNLYRSLRHWDRVEHFAREMEHKARIQYFTTEQKFQQQQEKLSAPLFAYIAYAKLLYACVSEGKGDYEQALHFTYDYADLNWVKETDNKSVYWKNLFNDWAQANTYANKLMNGDLDVLSDYVAYIEKRPHEVRTALFNIMHSANRYSFNVDSVLLQFESEIKGYDDPQTNNIFEGQVIPDDYVRLLYELSLYYLQRSDYLNGFNFTMKGLEYSVVINKEDIILKYVSLFEEFRSAASNEITDKYKNLIKKVCVAL